MTALATTALAENFPLEFRTIPPASVMAFPGGSGSFSQLRLARPAGLKREPRANSRHPLYGEFRATRGEAALMFRLDESKGDGTGYDQLVVDMNQNGDLTDDAAAARVAERSDRPASSPAAAPMLFGPIPTPAGKTIAGGRPVYYAQAYLYNLSVLRLAAQNTQTLFIGQLRLKPGWYLETTVELNGVKHKVGVVDGDSNLRLGEAAKALTSTTGNAKEWYFVGGDNLLVDRDGSGSFKNDLMRSSSCPFGPLLYLEAKPGQVTLSADGASLSVQAWTEPLAEVELQPRGAQVRDLTLARQRFDGQWELLRPWVAEGKLRLPPGDYRLYDCTLAGGTGREQVIISGGQRLPKPAFSFAAGSANRLNCGAPLNIAVTAEKRRPDTWEASRYPKASALDSDYLLSISARVCGGDGEVFSTFRKGAGEPPKPSFTVAEAGGKPVASGNLEYG